ncbi:MAG: tetratricopeptide repeat protein, partial [Gemmatimonadales bacterium]
RQMRRAVELSPNNATAHYILGTALPLVGRLDEGIEEIRKALVLDPLYAHLSSWLARFFLYAKDYPSAIAQGLKTLEIEEDDVRAFVFIGSAHLALGDAQAALEWYQRGQGLDNAVRSYDAMIVRALAALGRRDEAEAILTRLDEQSRQQYVRAEYLAMGHAAMGDMDRAFLSLERAYQARSGGLIYLHVDPGYKPLRSDPRFQELVTRIGLK